MHDPGALLLVLLLGDPHGLEAGQTRHSLRRSFHMDLKLTVHSLRRSSSLNTRSAKLFANAAGKETADLSRELTPSSIFHTTTHIVARPRQPRAAAGNVPEYT